MPDIRAAALDYIARDLAVVPVHPQTKKPTQGAWQKLRITAEEVPNYFNGEPQNIGIILGGASSGATDIDLDCPEAIAAAPFILPETATFGHAAKPRSHYIYRTPLCETESRAAIKLASANKLGILEIRIGGGERGAQTVFPPSIHTSGEPIAWVRGPDHITTIDGAKLLPLVHRLAAAAQCAMVYPLVGGRHDGAFVLGGFLHRCGFTAKEIAAFIQAVAANQTADKCADMLRTSRDGAGVDHPAGFPLFVKTFGEAPAKLVAEWLNYPFADADEIADTEWEDPIPLPGLLPVDPFDVNFLPASIGPWCKDIATRMQCPLDFVAVAAMAALGSVIGNKLAIRPKQKDPWFEVANLWGLTVGHSGTMKSPAMSEALRPLKRLEILAQTKNTEELQAYQYELKLHKIRDDIAQKNVKTRLDPLKPRPTGEPMDEVQASDLKVDMPEAPLARRFMTNDTSYEKLGEILVANPTGVLIWGDELIPHLRELEREEKVLARGFYLAAWCGMEQYSFERIMRGQTFITAACISLLGTTQPATFNAFMHTTQSRNDGMTQRLGLLVWPDPPTTWKNIDEYPNADAKKAAWDTFTYLADLKPEAVNAITEDEYARFPYLRLSPEAQELFNEWLGEHSTRMRSDEWEPALKSHFDKYRKLVASLALINHLADRGVGPVTYTAVERALMMIPYLETHAKRAYATGVSGTDAAAALLRHIKQGARPNNKQGALPNNFTARDVDRKCWAGLSKHEDVQAALDTLEKFNWVKRHQITEGKRTWYAYLIHPSVQP